MNTGDIDLSAYFNRIGYGGTVRVDHATLLALHRHHVTHIPFENLDVLLGRALVLDPAGLQAKLVTARRGGYCFEQNGLFLAVLREIGFEVEALAARVWWARQDTSLPMRTHMSLKVTVGAESYLCDVGFGGMTPPMPLSWRPGLEQKTGHEVYRLVESTMEPGGGLALEAQIDGAWAPLYSFRPRPETPADFALANWYVATHPASFFTQAMIATMPFAGGRHVLQERKVTIRAVDRSETVRQVTDTADLANLLQETYGLALPPADIAALWARLPASVA